MAFPEDVLSDDERVVMHLHPHWKALIWPGIVTIIAIGGTIAAALLNQVALIIVGALAVIGFFWLAVWPYLKWRTTHYVFTTERIIMREGVFSRDGRDIPLDRVNDVSFHHTFFERLLGTGVLTIESAGEHGQVVLKEIPKVEKVQSQLYALVDDDTENRNDRQPRPRQHHEANDGDTQTLSGSTAKSHGPLRSIQWERSNCGRG